MWQQFWENINNTLKHPKGPSSKDQLDWSILVISLSFFGPNSSIEESHITNFVVFSPLLPAISVAMWSPVHCLTVLHIISHGHVATMSPLTHNTLTPVMKTANNTRCYTMPCCILWALQQLCVYNFWYSRSQSSIYKKHQVEYGRYVYLYGTTQIVWRHKISSTDIKSGPTFVLAFTHLHCPVYKRSSLHVNWILSCRVFSNRAAFQSPVHHFYTSTQFKINAMKHVESSRHWCVNRTEFLVFFTVILFFVSCKMQHWQNSELRELLLIQGEEEMRRQVTGTYPCCFLLLLSVLF